MKYFSSSSSFDLFIYTPFCFCLLKSLFSIIFWNDWTSLIIPKVTIKTSQWAINQTIEHSTNCPQRVNSRCGCKNFTDECFWWVKRNLNSLNAPSQARTGLWAAVQHSNSGLYESLSSSSKSHSSDKKQKLVYSGKASHLEQIRMEGRMKRAGMTFASHPSEFVVKQSTRLTSTTIPPRPLLRLSPPCDGLGGSPPCLLPIILVFLARWPVRGPAKAGNAPVRRPGDTR